MRRIRRSLVLLPALVLLSLPAGAEAALRVEVRGEQPSFKGGIHHYALASSVCSRRFRLRVETPGKTRARIGSGSKFSGARTRRLRLRPSQSIRVTRYDRAKRRNYYFRCLPTDFPAYRHETYRPVQTGLFVVSPFRPTQRDPRYAVIFDRHGAPVWWHQGFRAPTDAKVLPNGLIAWAPFLGPGYGADPRIAYQLRRPDGVLVGRLKTVGTITDFHDLQQTADGNYLLLSYKQRGGVDTSQFTGPGGTASSVLDAVVQKVAPNGTLLWEWNSKDHIELSESRRWWPNLVEPYDIVHINSVEETANGDYLISLRHTDAVYRLDGTTGQIEWKLGGTTTPESLTVIGDPSRDYPFGGQHDARELADGDVTVHDNGTNFQRPPRAVRYEITGNTATLVDAQRDPAVPTSNCCGSSRSIRGSWIMSWGGQSLVTEFNPRGRRTFVLGFTDSSFSYRANPVSGGVTVARLRRGMDAKVPPKD